MYDPRADSTRLDMARKSKAVTLIHLSELVRVVTPEILAEIPHIESAHAQLSGMVSEVQGLIMERSVHEARAQEVSRRIEGSLEAGSRIATFMRLGLRLHYGPDNERLTAFRIKPSRSRKRPRKAVDSEAPPAIDGTED